MLGLTAVAGVAEPSDRWRMEGSANAFRDGKSIEFGLITPGLFQFQSGSRHHRSIFVTAGLHSLANPLRVGQAQVDEELQNLDVIAGLFAHGRFYNDVVYEYGKLAVGHLEFDGDLGGTTESATGALLESGLEFRSTVARVGLSSADKPLFIHLGLRWRFGFDPIDGLRGRPDPLEGISFVLGSRLSGRLGPSRAALGRDA